MQQHQRSITILQATQETPMLARLTELTRDSVERLSAVQFLIPPALRSSIKPGPIEGSSWCLLLDNNASAAKIRQLLPAIAAHLRSKGWEVNSIRLKVQMARGRSL